MRWLLDDRLVLRVALVVGVVVRLAVFAQTSSLTTKIVDEQDYEHLAASLAHGRGFSSVAGEPTSIRPPLYPAFVATVWRITGRESLQAVRAVQILLALASTWLVFELGRRLFDRRVGRYAAAAFFLYPTLIFLNSLVLTEILFTFFFILFIWSAARLVETPGVVTAVVCGMSLGLGALTRSILWPYPLLFCPLLVFLVRGPRTRRLAMPALVLLGYLAVVGPWAVRNTRLQGVPTVVDTMGGLNLRMGNYEFTPYDRMWDAVSLTGDRSWVHGINADFPDRPPTEGEKDKWAQRKAIEYMRAHPVLTLERAAIKFSDFWGIEREFLAGVDKGLFNVPLWIAAPIALVMAGAYVVVALLGVAGMWLARPRWRLHLVVLLPALTVMGIHTIVFGHSRYHIPLVPVLVVYGAALITRPGAWRHSPWFIRTGAVTTVALLLAIWIRQIAVVDAARLRGFLS